MPDHVTELTVTNDTAKLGQVRAFVRAGLDSGGFSPQAWNRIVLAVDEAVTNLIEHGYEGLPTGCGNIALQQTVSAQQYTIHISDDAVTHYDPRQHPDVDMERHIAAGRSGGLGVFIMRRVMDVIDYHYQSGEYNRLTLTKYAEHDDEDGTVPAPG